MHCHIRMHIAILMDMHILPVFVVLAVLGHAPGGVHRTHGKVGPDHFRESLHPNLESGTKTETDALSDFLMRYALRAVS